MGGLRLRLPLCLGVAARGFKMLRKGGESWWWLLMDCMMRWRKGERVLIKECRLGTELTPLLARMGKCGIGYWESAG